VERELDVRTAEAIAVRYDLAGVGSRFLALVTDLAIQIGVAVALVVAAITFVALTSQHSAAEVVRSSRGLEEGARAILIAAGAIAVFVLFFGYFIVFELLWNGQSPGKRLLGIRVVRDGGFPVDAGASVVRNLVRIVEAAFGFYVISAAVSLIGSENKRLGDFAAGTIVVRDAPAAVPTLAAITIEAAVTDDGLDREDRALIESYLARRNALEPQAAMTIAAAIAGRVRPKLRASFHYLDDAALLEHLARSRG
jgi:uncharacterized RDD family membrane protein YckC